MTHASSIHLLAPLTLLLACGEPGAGAGDSLSATSGASAITSASTTPTTSDGTGDLGGSTPTSTGDEVTTQTSDDASTSAASTTHSDDSTGTTAAGTTGTTGRTSETTGSRQPIPCQVEDTQITPTPPDVLLVIDKSGSMSNEKWDHDEKAQTPDVTRWSSLHGVVESIVTNFDTTVNFGLKLYPFLDATPFEPLACIVAEGVEVEVAPENGATVLSVLPAADFKVLGGTPVKSGLVEAYTYLEAVGPTHQRFALLVTDGEISKTCAGEIFKEALGAVKTAFLNGIPTYVVGIDIDGSTFAQLSSLALLGGKPDPKNPFNFYQTSSQIELQAALQQIVDDTLSCVVDVLPEPSEPELFEVWIGAAEVPAVTDCEAEDGWVWAEEYGQIELCGQACLDLKKSHQVEARYFCAAG